MYKCVVADPPWAERGGGKIKRGADRHYPLLSEREIVETMISCRHWSRVESDAHLWLWVTNNFLESGLFVMRALGFRYVTNAVWAKHRMGLGQYMRGQHELCLFGVRGRMKPKPTARSTPSLISGGILERTKHSRKPDEFFAHVEKISEGPYLEMFAREQREGWECWGNEVRDGCPIVEGTRIGW